MNSGSNERMPAVFAAPGATALAGRVRGLLKANDVDALLDFEKRAPAARTALPTWEHYAPLLVAAGAAAQGRPRVTFPITGWWMGGAFTKRSVQLD